MSDKTVHVLSEEHIRNAWDMHEKIIPDSVRAMTFARAIERAVLAASEDRRDAERYRWATALEDNAEMLYSVVLCHGGDQAKIDERVDAYRDAAIAAAGNHKVEG